MIYRTYIDKINTIVKDSKLNSSLNPCCELHHMNIDGVVKYSRVLLYFNESKIKELIENKTFANRDKVKHILHLTNCGSIDFTDIHDKKLSEISNYMGERATSFDLLLSVLPQDKPLFDGGKGYDMIATKFTLNDTKFLNNKQRFLSEEGSSWYQPRNGYKWNEEGVYSTSTLSEEYEKFGAECKSEIIKYRQHFDIGNENINIDITDLVNDYLDGKMENKGIMLSFTPLTELSKTDNDQYITFFTNKTSMFFEPYVETIYDDFISDDRGSFTLNKKNRLYLYCNVGGRCVNLDELPICTIDDRKYEVKQFSQGIYYAEVLGDKALFNTKQMYYDIWSNIKYNGVLFDDVEMDFIVHSVDNFFNFGNSLEESKHFTAQIYGIKENEDIKRGDLRKLTLLSREDYSKNKCNIVDEAYYCLYILDGTRELDIMPWTRVNKTVKETFFNIDTNILIPHKYYIDIKYRYNMEEICQKNILSFNIVDDLNNKYN